MANDRRFRKLIIFGGLILLLSGASLAAANAFFSVSDAIYEGVMAGDVALGGLTRNEAAQKIKNAYEKEEKPDALRLIGEQETWVISKNELAMEIDAEKTAEIAYRVGREGNLFNRFQERYLAANKTFTVQLATSYDKDKLRAKIEAVAKKIDRLPKNAEIKYADENLQFTKEESGYRLDLDKLEKEISVALTRQLPPLSIKIAAEKIEAKIKADDLKGIDARLARYTTQYDANDYNRQKNISLAAEKLTGILLKPGEKFSFNDLVGLRTQANGYLDAPVYIDGKLAVDIGGGVCQVSTTIYNAALLSDLKIEERSSHYRPPGYVPLGYDAAVADGLLDLKFINDTGAPLYIAVNAAAGSLTVDIYGRHFPEGQEMKIAVEDKKIIEPTVVIKQDAELEFGREVVETEGAKGYYVSLSRVLLQDGRIVKKEILSADEFTPEAKVVRIGTKLFKGKK